MTVLPTTKTLYDKTAPLPHVPPQPQGRRSRPRADEQTEAQVPAAATTGAAAQLPVPAPPCALALAPEPTQPTAPPPASAPELPTEETPRTPHTPRSTTFTRHARRAMSLAPLLLLAIWAALDWTAVSTGVMRLTDANPWWLLVGAGFTFMGCVVAALIRQGALHDRLAPGPLVASQFAAGAANHVLPASLGAHAVTLRFLQRQGVPLPRATASLALYSLVRALAKTPVVLAFVILAPEAVRPDALLPNGKALLTAVVGLLLIPALAALALAAIRPLRRPTQEFVRTALTGMKGLHARPSRFIPLWGGALAAPLMQAGVVASVGTALNVPMSWLQLAFAYLAASTAAGAVPAPGGIGPLDAALILTLAGYGTPLSLATATVLGYRVLTVWVPLVPGMLVMSAMVQREML